METFSVEEGTFKVVNTRAYKAGEAMGKAIVEMVHLMYQNNTATHFYQGLCKTITSEMKTRITKSAEINSKSSRSVRLVRP